VSGVLIGSETSAAYLPVAPVGNGASLTANVPASSAAYFITSGSGARTIQITNSSGTTSSDPNGRVYVMRVQ